MSAGSSQPPIDPRVLEAAAEWYVQFQLESQNRPAAARQREAWQSWLAAHPMHRQAWERMQALEQRLQRLPAALAMPALAGVDARRRSTIKLLGLALAAGPTAWVASRTLPWQSWSADYRTETGERRSLDLADGSRVMLNTASALDVCFDTEQRLLRLHAGEILVQTAADPLNRPFVVTVPQGQVRALGTRFGLRTQSHDTRVAVLEHQVEIDHADGRQRVSAGHQLDFSATRLGPEQALDGNADAWTRGLLIAPDWPLHRFVGELGRYREGHIGLDPAIAELRVTGVFRLDDIDGALDNLAASLPIRIKTFSRYWVRLLPR